MPNKKLVIGAAVVFVVAMLAYNNVPAVRRVLGGA